MENDQGLEAFNAWFEKHRAISWLAIPEKARSRPSLPSGWGMAYRQSAFDGWQAALQSPEVQALRKDAERLDWLDATNAPFKMGWRFGIAPAGNVHPYTVVQLYGALTTVREGIDAAMEKQP